MLSLTLTDSKQDLEEKPDTVAQSPSITPQGLGWPGLATLLSWQCKWKSLPDPFH